MDIPSLLESAYPVSFRQEVCKKLGSYLQLRQSVNIIGMRRVGISNFLRFFLHNPEIVSRYISKTQQHLFIPVDLNDLVERELYPFWTLTLKRVVDACEASSLPEGTKGEIRSLFVTSIQSRNSFFVIDTIRTILRLVVAEGVYPTIFFIRFDRLADAFNVSLFDNLEGLYDATHQQLAYVFTSYRSLDSLFPTAKTSLSVLAQQMYVHPATEADMHHIYHAFEKRFQPSLPISVAKALFSLVKGNVQYLQLALIILHEKRGESPSSKQALLEILVTDERIMLESEELWESLTKEEKKILLQIAREQRVPEEEKAKTLYLWEAGFVTEEKHELVVFSPLFFHYLLNREPEEAVQVSDVHLTRKEHSLFSLLEAHLGEICEREQIIEVVWPEYQEFGVSDWAIDRLVARVRVKLREQKSPYEVVTVRTRGYKLAKVKD